MNTKAFILVISCLPLLLIVPKEAAANQYASTDTTSVLSHAIVTKAGTIKFASGETRRFVTISGVRDCSSDKHEVQPGKLILRMFPSSATPEWIFVPLEKVTHIKFTKIFKRYDEGRSGSTGTSVEVTTADGKKETFEAWSLTIRVEPTDSVAAFQYSGHNLWGRRDYV